VLAGDFLTAVVAPPRLEEAAVLLDGYRALTEQLGGEFTVLKGSPATMLRELAKSRDATEMVLAHDGAGRHPVLRELARDGSGADLHILPLRGDA
jgi:K+-sensing histidine kinase KdpD